MAQGDRKLAARLRRWVRAHDPATSVPLIPNPPGSDSRNLISHCASGRLCQLRIPSEARHERAAMGVTEVPD
jgi:hypothetical protein